MTITLLRPFDAPEPQENGSLFIHGFQLAMCLFDLKRCEFFALGHSVALSRYLAFEDLKASFTDHAKLGEIVIKGMSRFLSVQEADLLDSLESAVEGGFAEPCHQL
jgi:hypothetical protein